MNILTIVIIGLIVLETANVTALCSCPGSRLANSVGIFAAWEKSKQDPEIPGFVRTLVNWVAGTKLIFVLLLIVIAYAADRLTPMLTSAGLVIWIASFLQCLAPT
jgi:hypothetical protein